MQILNTNLFRINYPKINNSNDKPLQKYVTEPIKNENISNSFYYPTFGTNVAVFEKMEKLASSKNVNKQELKTLFEGLSDACKKNFNSFVEKFSGYGYSSDDFLIVYAKFIQLFKSLPETIESNVKESVNKFKDNGLTMDKYINVCVKAPSLFY